VKQRERESARKRNSKNERDRKGKEGGREGERERLESSCRRERVNVCVCGG